MANNTGTLVIAPIRPYSDTDIFPSAYANELKGGFQTVLNYTDLSGISSERLMEGMVVNVTNEDKMYRLSGSTWVQILFSGYDDTELRTELSGETSTRVSADESLAVAISGVSASIVYATTIDPYLAMPEDVGGIDAGTTAGQLSGKSFTYLFDNLLFPTVAPTLTAPSFTFVKNANSIYEVDTSVSIQFTTTFNRGSIYNGATFQDYRSGEPNQYNYTGDGLVTITKSDLTDVQVVSSYDVLLGNQSWTASVSYDEGVQALDNKGNPSGSPLAAGTTSTSTITIEGVYPLFATTVSIGTLTQQSLVSMATQQIPSANGFTLVAETSGGNKQKFDIPIAWTNFPISSVQNFDTNSNSWVYEGGTAATSLTYWTESDVTHSGRDYKRFTYNGGDRGEMKIRINL